MCLRLLSKLCPNYTEIQHSNIIFPVLGIRVFFSWSGGYYLSLDCCRDYSVTASFVPHLHVSHMIAFHYILGGGGGQKKDHAQSHIAAGCLFLA